MICPNCKKEIPNGQDCPACGIVIAKFRPRTERAQAEEQPARPAAKPAQAAPPPAPLSPSSTAFARERPWPFRPVSDSKLAGLHGQMSRMLESGMPLNEALRLAARKTHGRLADSLSKVRLSVEKGATLSVAMAADPVLFPDPVRSLVEAGEATGGLPSVFSALADAIELRLTLRRRILRACVYPFILFTLSFFLLPIAKLFTGGVGDYLRSSLVPYVGTCALIAAVLFLLPWALRGAMGPRLTNRLLRRLPVAGKLLKVRATLRFSRHLSTSLGAGLDVFSSLRLAARASGDMTVVTLVEEAAGRIREGASLEESLGETGLFDEEFMLAVASGEASGRLQQALEQQARLAQDSYVHRLEVVVQLSSVAVLLLVYLYVAWSILEQYRSILGGTSEQIQQLMKEAGGGLPGAGGLPEDLKGILQ